jgi:hypothetical protein
MGQTGSRVNCSDLAALCFALIEALGGSARGIMVQPCGGGQLTPRADQRPMGCPPAGSTEPWDYHFIVADVPSADGSRCWVDTTLGPSPWAALRAPDARGYSAAAFDASCQPVHTQDRELYSCIEWVAAPPLHDDELTALLTPVTVELSTTLATWRRIFGGRTGDLSAGSAFADGLLRRGAAVFGPGEDGALLSPSEAQAENAAVRVELAIFGDAEQASKALDRAPEALPQPRGAPVPSASPTVWRPLPGGLKLRTTGWGEVMLAGGCALLRIQPLRRDAGPARDLAVYRALEAFDLSS